MRMRYLVVVLAFGLGVISCSGRKATSAASNEQGRRRILYYHDPMHPSYRSDRPGIAPDCNMALTPVYADDSVKPERSATIRVNDEQAAAIGLRTEAAREEAASGEVRSVGRVEAQESRPFLVRAGGSGAKVLKGQPLASYYSRDIASPQQAYLYALDAQQRLGTAATVAQK